MPRIRFDWNESFRMMLLTFVISDNIFENFLLKEAYLSR